MTVDWTIAQLVMPMEAMVADPPSPPWFCMERAISEFHDALELWWLLCQCLCGR